MTSPDNEQQQAKKEAPNAHVVHMACPVTPASIQCLHNVILGALSQRAGPIQLRISSEGGHLASGFAAYGLLSSIPIPLRTHNNGNVESVAVLLYLAGSERTTAEHSRFVLHPLNWGTPAGQVDHSRLSEWNGSLNFDRDRYCAIFKQATQGAEIPIDVSKHLQNEALIIGPAAARTSGIVTGAVSADCHDLPSENVTHWWVDRF